MNLKLVTLTLLIGLGLTWPSEAFAAKEKFVFVDIKKKANASLEKEWWTGAPKKTTYALLPLGKVDKFAGPGDQKVECKIKKKPWCYSVLTPFKTYQRKLKASR